MKLENIPPMYEAYRAEYPDLTVCRIALQEKGLVLGFCRIEIRIRRK